MSKGSVDLRKIRRIAALAFKNALRLHEDSVLLYRGRAWPSAYQLSVLAVEELGKFGILEDLAWHCDSEGPWEPEQVQKWLQLIYKHHIKQKVFVNRVWPPRSIEPLRWASRWARNVHSGGMEQKKQDAVYVGLRRENGKVEVHGRISSPFRLSRSRVKEQITMVNDQLLVLAAGVLKGQYSVDVPEVETCLTRGFVRRLRRKWPTMERTSRRRLRVVLRLTDVGDADREEGGEKGPYGRPYAAHRR